MCHAVPNPDAFCHAVAVGPAAFNDPEEWVTLARVARPQGRRGELLCDLFTDFPEKFAERRSLFLRCGAATEATPVTLDEFWLPTGKSAGRVVLKFANCNSITEAEQLAGCDVVLPAAQRVTLEHDTFYVSDLLGCVVVNLAGDGPENLGTVTDVHSPTDSTGRRLEDAAPILVVTRLNGDEVMIPLAKEFLQHPDLANRLIEMRLPKGLIEANG